MSWLDVFTPSKEIRPARPADEKLAGRKIDQGTVGTSSTSSTSSNKTCNVNVDEVPPTITTADTPTPEQLAHARRMLVDCPNTPGVKWHCWYCSRCPKANKCGAWRRLAADVKWFKFSGPPYSLILAETMQRGGDQRGTSARPSMTNALIAQGIKPLRCKSALLWAARCTLTE